jgi:integrase
MEVLMGARNDGVRRIKRTGRSVWIIDFRFLDKDGREQRYRRDARIQTAEGARAEARRLMQLAFETGSTEARPAAPTFADFVDTKFRPLHLKPPKCRPATVERYEYLLDQGILGAFGHVRLDSSFLEPARAYVAELSARGVQARPHMSLLRTVLRSAFDLGVVERLPDLPPLPKPGKKLPDAPPKEHVLTLLERAPGWLRPAIGLAAYAGLRAGEVRALEVRDVDVVNERILVRRAFSANEVLTPKSTHERVVPLIPELRAILAPALKSKLPNARVILTRNGTTPKRSHVLTALKYLETKLGVRAWSFHALRHFFISELVRLGVSIEVIRQLAGHSKLDVTQRYVHAEASELRAAMSRFSG